MSPRIAPNVGGRAQPWHVSQDGAGGELLAPGTHDRDPDGRDIPPDDAVARAIARFSPHDRASSVEGMRLLRRLSGDGDPEAMLGAILADEGSPTSTRASACCSGPGTGGTRTRSTGWPKEMTSRTARVRTLEPRWRRPRPAAMLERHSPWAGRRSPRATTPWSCAGSRWRQREAASSPRGDVAAALRPPALGQQAWAEAIEAGDQYAVYQFGLELSSRGEVERDEGCGPHMSVLQTLRGCVASPTPLSSPTRPGPGRGRGECAAWPGRPMTAGVGRPPHRVRRCRRDSYPDVRRRWGTGDLCGWPDDRRLAPGDARSPSRAGPGRADRGRPGAGAAPLPADCLVRRCRCRRLTRAVGPDP